MFIKQASVWSYMIENATIFFVNSKLWVQLDYSTSLRDSQGLQNCKKSRRCSQKSSEVSDPRQFPQKLDETEMKDAQMTTEKNFPILPSFN